MSGKNTLYFGEELSGVSIEEDYIIGDKLGEGNFSTVFACENRETGEKCAVKVINKANLDVNVESLHQEVAILKQVDHPNIVGLLDIYETSRKVYLVMELMTGGELFDRIVERYPNGYSEAMASALIKKVVSALQYLHRKGIVHRDLKPENLLYESEAEDAEIKITDFGLAKLQRKDAMLKTACGTPNYVAPEVILGEPYGERVDLWSVGVILYILLCGFPPFYHQDTNQLFEQIVAGKYKFPSPYWDNVSSSAKDLIQRLLRVQPRDRYTADQCLAHPWIKGTTAKEEVMEGLLGELKSFNAKRKLKLGMDAILAVVRLMKAMGPKGEASGSSSSS